MDADEVNIGGASMNRENQENIELVSFSPTSVNQSTLLLSAVAEEDTKKEVLTHLKAEHDMDLLTMVYDRLEDVLKRRSTDNVNEDLLISIIRSGIETHVTENGIKTKPQQDWWTTLLKITTQSHGSMIQKMGKDTRIDSSSLGAMSDQDTIRTGISNEETIRALAEKSSNIRKQEKSSETLIFSSHWQVLVDSISCTLDLLDDNVRSRFVAVSVFLAIQWFIFAFMSLDQFGAESWLFPVIYVLAAAVFSIVAIPLMIPNSRFFQRWWLLLSVATITPWVVFTFIYWNDEYLIRARETNAHSEESKTGNTVFFFYPFLASTAVLLSYFYLAINRDHDFFMNKIHRFSLYTHDSTVWDWYKHPDGNPRGDPRRDVLFGWTGCFNMIGEFFCPRSDLETEDHVESVVFPIRLHVGVIFALMAGLWVYVSEIEFAIEVYDQMTEGLDAANEQLTVAYSYNATEDDLAAMILEYQVALATNGESNNLSPDCLSCYSTASTYVEQTSSQYTTTNTLAGDGVRMGSSRRYLQYFEAHNSKLSKQCEERKKRRYLSNLFVDYVETYTNHKTHEVRQFRMQEYRRRALFSLDDPSRRSLQTSTYAWETEDTAYAQSTGSDPNTWYSDAKDWIDELTDAADGFYYGLLTGSTVGFIYVICSCFIVYKVWRKKTLNFRAGMPTIHLNTEQVSIVYAVRIVGVMLSYPLTGAFLVTSLITGIILALHLPSFWNVVEKYWKLICMYAIYYVGNIVVVRGFILGEILTDWFRIRRLQAFRFWIFSLELFYLPLTVPFGAFRIITWFLCAVFSFLRPDVNVYPRGLEDWDYGHLTLTSSILLQTHREVALEQLLRETWNEHGAETKEEKLRFSQSQRDSIQKKFRGSMSSVDGLDKSLPILNEDEISNSAEI